MSESNVNKKRSLLMIAATLIPLATIAAWAWAGFGYIKQIEINSNEITELKRSIQKLDDEADAIRIQIGVLRVTTDLIRQEQMRQMEAGYDNGDGLLPTA